MLELVRSKTQNFTIIDQEKHKIKKIYIILETHDYQTYYVNIDLCHQYGISVAEKQTFLLAKHPSQRQGAKRNSCVRRPHFPLPHTTHKYYMSVPETTTSTLLPQPINSTNFINFMSHRFIIISQNNFQNTNVSQIVIERASLGNSKKSINFKIKVIKVRRPWRQN